MEIREAQREVVDWFFEMADKHPEKLSQESNLYPQFTKIVEEVGEIAEILSKGLPKDELRIEVGDLFVTIFSFCSAAGLDAENCLKKTMTKIRGRL